MAQLRLAVDNAARVELHARPFRTFYYHSRNDGEADPAKTSRAKTLRGAVKAAVTRVAFGEYQKVVICHDEGYRMVTVKRSGRGKTANVEIFGWFMEV